MSLEAVVQRILEHGTAEALAIVEAARAETDGGLREIKEKGQRDVGQRVADGRKAAERLRVQETARAELASRKIVLASQKEILDMVKTEALRFLGSPENRREILDTLLEKHGKEWRSGKVYCTAEDRQLVQDAVGARFGGTIECSGGIVIESEDETRRIDLRSETILQDIWEDSVKELADILWPKR
jgi:V/A-type H+-transporting ATPase subunit E